MLCGIPPFYNENLEKMYEMIKDSDVKFPKRIKISEEAKDLIFKVLEFFYFILKILVVKKKSKRKNRKSKWFSRNKTASFLYMF